MASSSALLRSRSSYSFLRGTASPLALARRAAALGHTHLALTDVDSLAAAWFFAEAAAEVGLHAVHGLRLTDARHGGAVTLLARDREGYRSLCQLVSARQLDPGFDLEPALLHAPGVVVLVDDARRLARLGGRLPPRRLRAELVRDGSRRPGALRNERALLDAARRHRVSVVASPAPVVADASEADAHHLLRAIAERAHVDRLPRRPAPALPTPAELAHRYRDLPGALGAAHALAEQCDVDLTPASLTFPRSGVADPLRRLRRLCREGLRTRYGDDLPPGAHGRLARELAVIADTGFVDYFLVVREIVGHARALGAPIAGRGSGASSLVAYVLGITNVCPMRFDLCFERFLQPHRTSPPDIDIDFCWRTREAVIEHVQRLYGEGCFAMVCTHICFRAPSAFRAAGRAVGLSDEQLSRLRPLLPDAYLAGEPERIDARQVRESARADVPPALFARALRAASSILGCPSHYSVHPGGVVITPCAIARVAPLVRAAKGITLTQYEKDTVEAVGLVKLDLLGNRAVSTLDESLRHCRALHGTAPDPDAPEIGALDRRDPATSRLLSRGDAIGVNQLESPAMRRLLVQCRAADEVELMRILALVRPGAAGEGNKDAYVRRVHGDEPPDPPHPALAGCLADNRGVLLYEDDLILVTSALTGVSLADGDRWRRRIQKARPDQRPAVRAAFLAAVADPDAAELAWQLMARFHQYAFCKAHAASYARIAYAAAYMKAHYPLAFWVAALNNNQGMYDKRVYLEEARRAGIAVRLPCVNRSGPEFTPELDGGVPAIRIGLSRIRGLRADTIDALLALRPFEDLGDLLARSDVSRSQLALLIRAGALDFAGKRPELLLGIRLLRAHRPRCARTASLVALPPPELPELPDYPPERKSADEFTLLGLAVHAHPLAALRPRLPGRLATSRDLPRRVGRRVELVAIADASRRVTTAQGDAMQFLTLEDEHGIFEATLFPDVYRRHRDLLHGGIGPYRLTGVVMDEHGALTLRIERATAWPAEHPLALLPLHAGYGPALGS